VSQKGSSRTICLFVCFDPLVVQVTWCCMKVILSSTAGTIVPIGCLDCDLICFALTRRNATLASLLIDYCSLESLLLITVVTLPARPFPMKGNFYANCFVHFEPYAPKEGKSNYDADLDIPPYLIADSVWHSAWKSDNPRGWKKVGVVSICPSVSQSVGCSCCRGVLEGVGNHDFFICAFFISRSPFQHNVLNAISYPCPPAMCLCACAYVMCQSSNGQ
jgi:hypothetical protein